jgi:hypothetical protein
MNKYFIIFILTLISYQTKAQYFEIQKFVSKNQFDREFTFPIISNTKNKEAAKKINNILQLEILDTNFESKKDGMFNNLSENGMHGITNINYEIKENSKLFLSIVFRLETLWAYEDLITQVYNFNSMTGDFIDFDAVFDPNKIKWIHDEAKYQFTQDVIKTIKADFEYSLKSGKMLEDEVFQSYAGLFDCIEKTKFHEFYINQNSIVFERDYCFNRGKRAFEQNFTFSISTEKIPKTTLTSLGRKLIKDNIPILEWRGNLETGKLLFSGKIEDKYEFIASLKHFGEEQQWHGTYWYTKHGKPIELKGFLDEEGYLFLKEENGEFRFRVNDYILSGEGIWMNNNGKESSVTIE